MTISSFLLEFKGFEDNNWISKMTYIGRDINLVTFGKFVTFLVQKLLIWNPLCGSYKFCHINVPRKKQEEVERKWRPLSATGCSSFKLPQWYPSISLAHNILFKQCFFMSCYRTLDPFFQCNVQIEEKMCAFEWKKLAELICPRLQR